MRSLSASLAILCFLATPAHADNKPTRATIDPQAEPQVSEAPDPVETATRVLDDAWAEIFYRQPADSQAGQFKALLTRIRALKAQYPGRAEPLNLEAVTLCTLAAADWGFGSLSRVAEARELLVKSIDLDPKAMDATAFIALGNIYYRLPGWPLSFGDDDQARQYLETAVKLYPDGLDSNYFLGDYWLDEDEFDKALPYLEKANLAPIRPHHRLSDMNLKGELEKKLKAARNHDNGHQDFFSRITPDFGE